MAACANCGRGVAIGHLLDVGVRLEYCSSILCSDAWRKKVEEVRRSAISSGQLCAFKRALQDPCGYDGTATVNGKFCSKHSALKCSGVEGCTGVPEKECGSGFQGTCSKPVCAEHGMCSGHAEVQAAIRLRQDEERAQHEQDGVLLLTWSSREAGPELLEQLYAAKERALRDQNFERASNFRDAERAVLGKMKRGAQKD